MPPPASIVFMEKAKKYIIPALVVLLVLFFVYLYVVTRPAPSSLTLSVTPSSQGASALSGAENAAGNGSTSGTGGSYSGTHGTAASAPAPAPKIDGLTDIRALPGASTFVSLLERTGVATGISPAGTYTFFVPTNAAFAASPLGPFSNMSLADQTRLAEFHIVVGKMMSVDALKAGFMTMFSRDDLNADVFELAQVGGNTRVLGIYPVRNGIVYLIDHVLLPPMRRPFPF